MTPLTVLAEGRHSDPFALLGPHDSADGYIVRTIQPAAHGVELRLVATGELRQMHRLAGGVFEGVLGGPERSALPSDRSALSSERSGAPDYRLRVTFGGGHVVEIDDPYRYGRLLSDYDLHL